MRMLVGTCFILAGLAVGTHGFSRVASNPPNAPLEIASERLPTGVVAPSPLPAVSAIVILPTKAPVSTSLPTPPPPVPAKRPTDGTSLVREVQQELRRVECYDGAVNGIWTTPTQEAMRAFVEHVNAKLPIDKPDHILLALVQGHTGHGCGSCPAGQQASRDGRCLPHAVVARASTQGTPVPHDAWRPVVSVAKPADVAAEPPRKVARSVHREPPIEGRMSVGAGIIAPVQPPERDIKLAAAAPMPSSPPAAQPQRERRAARHGDRKSAAGLRSRAYLRAMRPARYAYRPLRRSRGVAAFFGGLF
jgi:hypothetical protein